MPFQFTVHPDREALINEIRARPYEPLEIPERISHIAVVGDEDSVDTDRQHLEKLCTKYNVPPPPPGATHFVGDLGPFRLRWERHTEFCSYTFYRSEAFDDPFDNPVLNYVPQPWLESLPGKVLAAIHMAFEPADLPERSPEEMGRVFMGNTYLGCQVQGGAAMVWSDLRTHDDGFCRILVRDISLSSRQAGRLCQRLLEIETYRLMALMALPLAREVSPRIRVIDQSVAEVAAAMAGHGDGNGQSDAELLATLSQLAAEIEEISAATSYRFGGALAYYDIVQRRLNELREVRFGGLQTFSEFLERRLAPAMKTCTYTEQRQRSLSERVSRVASLLRARVEVGLEEQNRDLLESMNRRAQLQIRLQETVEGLSVVAISYYLVGLIGYALKGAKEGGILPIDPGLGMGLSVPLVAFFVWYSLRKMKKTLLKDGEH